MKAVPVQDSSTSPEIDPITLEVIRHGIVSICDQIDANMTRTAFSPYIYEYKDYAVGFVGSEGELLEQFQVTQEDLDSRHGVQLIVNDVRDEKLRASVNVLPDD